jgi:hypothetical protein
MLRHFSMLILFLVSARYFCCVQGGLDYRIDETQGLSAFTALQRQGIPSQLLYFPAEAHQVFNTRNQLKWHHSVLAWIGAWTNTPVDESESTTTRTTTVASTSGQTRRQTRTRSRT